MPQKELATVVFVRDMLIIRRPRKMRGMSMRMAAPTGSVSPG